MPELEESQENFQHSKGNGHLEAAFGKKPSTLYLGAQADTSMLKTCLHFVSLQLRCGFPLNLTKPVSLQGMPRYSASV